MSNSSTGNWTESFTQQIDNAILDMLPENMRGDSQFIVALLILAGSVILARIVYFFVERYFKKLASKTSSDVDDKLLALLQKPIYYTIILLGVQISGSFLLLSAPFFSGVFTRLIAVLLILIVTWVIAGTLDIVLKGFGSRIASKTDTTLDDEAIPFLCSVGKFAIYVLGLMIVLDQFGIEITPLVASLGIAGFAIGFAAKDTIGNILAGFFILTDRPFVRGDRVQIAGNLGNVIDIGLRSTKIETLDHTYVIIPNDKIITSEITNFALPDIKLKVKLTIGVAYGSDPDEVKKIILDVAESSQYLMKDSKPSVYFTAFGESAIEFLLVTWVDDFRKKILAQDDINTRLYSEFEKAGIEIPFPCRTVYMRKE